MPKALFHHGFLLAVGQTTNEHLQGVYAAAHSRNPHTRGCLGNYDKVLSQSTPASKLPDLTARVACDAGGPPPPARGGGRHRTGLPALA